MGRRVEPDLTHRSWDRPGVSAALEDIIEDEEASRDPRALALERSQIADLLLTDRLDPETAVRLLTAAGSDFSEAWLLVEALQPAIESPVIRWGVGAPVNPANFYDDADERTESRV